MKNDVPVAVLGAGSVGCYLGGRLLAAGANVLFIGRSSVKQEIGEKGLRLTDWKGYSAFIEPGKIRFETDPGFMKDAGIILLSVKCRDTFEAAVQIKGNTDPQALVVSLQNGVRNMKTLKEILPSHPLLAAVVPFNILHRAGGHFHCGTEGELILEKSDGRESSLAAMFEKAGIPVVPREKIQEVLWSKLLINLNNSVNALAGVPLVEELRNPLYRRILASSIEEGLRSLKRAGIKPARMGKVLPSILPFVLRLPNGLFLRVAKAMLNMDEEARSSMWEDLERRRPTEIDDLNGEILELSRKHGLSAPVNQAIVQRVKEAEKAGQGSPRMSAQQLWDAVHRQP